MQDFKKQKIVTLEPTPILNKKEFSEVFGGAFGGLALDASGLLKSLEMIAFEGEPLYVLDQFLDKEALIYQIEYDHYPSKTPLFVDSRFVKNSEEEKKFPLPIHQEKVLKNLLSMQGLPYVWGGNFSKGIEKMLSFYPPRRKLTPLEEYNWTFKGVDCSGLLYEATFGTTPRNTSELCYFGEGIDIKGKSFYEIRDLILPLDILVWKGHVVIALSKEWTIESRAHQGGVYISSLMSRLEAIVHEEKKNLANQAIEKDDVVLRRWFFH